MHHKSMWRRIEQEIIRLNISLLQAVIFICYIKKPNEKLVLVIDVVH